MYISKQNGRNKVSMLYAKEGRASEMTNDE
jgi:hypothetical protein